MEPARASEFPPVQPSGPVRAVRATPRAPVACVRCPGANVALKGRVRPVPWRMRQVPWQLWHCTPSRTGAVPIGYRSPRVCAPWSVHTRTQACGGRPMQTLPYNSAEGGRCRRSFSSMRRPIRSSLSGSSSYENSTGCTLKKHPRFDSEVVTIGNSD